MLHVLRVAGFAWILGGSCLVISGCGSGSDDGCTGDGCDPPPMTNAYHEHQFRDDPDLRAGDESTVILQLEASDPHENDSALEGVDIIPYRYEQSGEHQFCFAPDRDGRPHEFSVRQVGGTELLRIRPGECDSIEMDSGDYLVELRHADLGKDAEGDVVFIRPYDPLAKALSEPVLSNELSDGSTAGSASCSSLGTRVWSEELLAAGQVAVWGQDGAPVAGTDEVVVYSGLCNQVSVQNKWVAVGPSTQLLTFSQPNYGGFLFLLKSKQNTGTPMTQVPSIAVGTGAIAVSSLNLNEPNCEVEGAGAWCHCDIGCGCNPPLDYPDQPMPGAGQVLVIGEAFFDNPDPADNTQCCAPAHLFQGHCDDLGLIAFDQSIYGVILGDDVTMIDLFGDPDYAGLSSMIDSELNFGEAPPKPAEPLYLTLPSPGGGQHAGEGTIASLFVTSSQANNRQTLITTRSCTRCNLTGVDLHDEDLSKTQLDYADLSGANLTRTQFVGASLVESTLTSATASYANFSDATLSSAVFSEAGKKPAVLTNLLLKNTIMDDAVLDGVDLSNSMIIRPEGTQQPTLEGAFLVGATLTNVVFWDAILDEATLSGADFSSVISINTSFKNLKGATSAEESIVFSHAILYGADFTGTSCEFCEFQNALFSFNSGTYDLTYITGYDAELREYQSESLEGGVSYSANFPDRLPLTNANTTCPDTAIGPCLADINGGESHTSCEVDCVADVQCEDAFHCVANPWPSSSPGQWQCKSNECVTFTDSSKTTCGDGVCDMEDGESHVSCAKDCTKAYECDSPKHCVGLDWVESFVGHWSCTSHLCVPTSDDIQCSDGRCDYNGRWSALSVRVDYLGENDLNCW